MFQNYLESIKAFNLNAYYSLGYLIQTNIWLLLMCLACIGTMWLGFINRIERVVKEEHDVI